MLNPKSHLRSTPNALRLTQAALKLSKSPSPYLMTTYKSLSPQNFHISNIPPIRSLKIRTKPISPVPCPLPNLTHVHPSLSTITYHSQKITHITENLANSTSFTYVITRYNPQPINNPRTNDRSQPLNPFEKILAFKPRAYIYLTKKQ